MCGAINDAERESVSEDLIAVWRHREIVPSKYRQGLVCHNDDGSNCNGNIWCNSSHVRDAVYQPKLSDGRPSILRSPDLIGTEDGRSAAIAIPINGIGISQTGPGV